MYEAALSLPLSILFLNNFHCSCSFTSLSRHSSFFGMPILPLAYTKKSLAGGLKKKCAYFGTCITFSKPLFNLKC